MNEKIAGADDQSGRGLRTPLRTVGISALQQRGHQAYLVGGTIRDYLMGREPNDIDVATSASPEEMLRAFGDAGYRVIPTGIKHGTITVLDPEHGPVEVTTYRTEGTYSDSRRPDSVAFSNDIKQDLARRDLTIPRAPSAQPQHHRSTGRRLPPQR